MFQNKMDPELEDAKDKVPAGSLKPGDSFKVYPWSKLICKIVLKQEDFFTTEDQDGFRVKVEKGSFGYDNLVIKL